MSRLFHAESKYLAFIQLLVLNIGMRNPLLGYWADSGLQSEDIVLIHSSMKRTFSYLVNQGIEASPKLIIDSLRVSRQRTGLPTCFAILPSKSSSE